MTHGQLLLRPNLTAVYNDYYTLQVKLLLPG